MTPLEQAEKPKVRILVFADDPEQKPRMYVCAKCGNGTSPKIFAANEQRQHECAREAAENCYTCKTHNNCQDCGAECSKHWLVCSECRIKRQIAKRAHVAPDTFDECFTLDGDNMYYSPLEAAEDGHEWVVPAKPLEHFEIDLGSVLESMLERHYEDACVEDLKGLDALAAAVEAFNKAQTGGSFFPDEKLICNVSSLLATEDHPS